MKVPPPIAILLLIVGLGLSFGLASCGSQRSSKPVISRKASPSVLSKRKNTRVAYYVRLYQKTRYVEFALKRGQPYIRYIQRVFKRYRLPRELSYLPLLESAFKPHARSPAGAVGMWQFMEGTAKDSGLRVNWFRDERLNWKKSTVAAARHLRRLGRRFGYNWELVLAAYNCGEGCITQAIRKKTQNFWRLRLNPETRAYVPRFIALLQVAQKKYPSLYYVKS